MFDIFFKAHGANSVKVLLARPSSPPSSSSFPYKILRAKIFETDNPAEIKIRVSSFFGGYQSVVGPFVCPITGDRTHTWVDIKPVVDEIDKKESSLLQIVLEGPTEAVLIWGPKTDPLQKISNETGQFDLAFLSFVPTFLLLKKDDPSDGVAWLKNIGDAFGMAALGLYEFVVTLPARALEKLGIDPDSFIRAGILPLAVAATLVKSGPEAAAAVLNQQEGNASNNTEAVSADPAGKENGTFSELGRSNQETVVGVNLQPSTLSNDSPKNSPGEIPKDGGAPFLDKSTLQDKRGENLGLPENKIPDSIAHRQDMVNEKNTSIKDLQGETARNENSQHRTALDQRSGNKEKEPKDFQPQRSDDLLKDYGNGLTSNDLRFNQQPVSPIEKNQDSFSQEKKDVIDKEKHTHIAESVKTAAFIEGVKEGELRQNKEADLSRAVAVGVVDAVKETYKNDLSSAEKPVNSGQKEFVDVSQKEQTLLTRHDSLHIEPVSSTNLKSPIFQDPQQHSYRGREEIFMPKDSFDKPNPNSLGGSGGRNDGDPDPKLTKWVDNLEKTRLEARDQYMEKWFQETQEKCRIPDPAEKTLMQPVQGEPLRFNVARDDPEENRGGVRNERNESQKTEPEFLRSIREAKESVHSAAERVSEALGSLNRVAAGVSEIADHTKEILKEQETLGRTMSPQARTAYVQQPSASRGER